jgi:hypothetical protein
MFYVLYYNFKKARATYQITVMNFYPLKFREIIDPLWNYWIC